MKRISDMEYTALREEMNSRIQIMNTHNLGMITAVFAVWAIAGVILKDFYDVLNYPNISIATLYAVFISFLVVTPIGIILPLAVKSGDNLGQIMSLSGYLMLYAEMPRLIDGTNNKEEIIGWESMQKKEMERKFSDKFFNSEYFILSVFSILLLLAITVSVFCYWYYRRGSVNIAVILIVNAVLCISGIVATVCIMRKSRASLFIKRKSEYYERYCNSAIGSGMATAVDIQKYNLFLSKHKDNRREDSMYKINCAKVLETEKNLRKMMCSGKLYDPIKWEYLDGTDNLCGDVDRVAVMDKYQKRCRAAMIKYNKLPSTVAGDKKRKRLLDKIFGAVDCFRRIEAPCRANYGGRHTTLGGKFYAGYNLTLIEDGQIEIGDSTMIGPNVTICTAEHPKDIETRALGHGILYNKKVTIGNNVWIGANTTILAGATIGDNCIIGANSLITKDTVIPANKITVGIVTPKNVNNLKDIS